MQPDTLLIIGDSESDRPLLREIFQEEYNLLEADSIEQGVFLLENNRDCITAVLVDAPPPRGEGESFLERSRPWIGDIPVLVIISPEGGGRREELAFSLGAIDVIPRPYTKAVVRQRVKIAVDLFRSRQRLLRTLEQQGEQIRHTNEVMVDALSSFIECRGQESTSHVRRIRRLTEVLLWEVARSCPEYGLTPAAIRDISSAAALHDIGKISLPDHILHKNGHLTPEERKIMCSHTINGAQMVRSLHGATSEAYLRYAYNICRFHHERWDGSGYPDGLKGEDIPICAQVVGVADAYDGLVSEHSYRDALPRNTAVNMILNGACGQFSPKLMACFKHVSQQFMTLEEELAVEPVVGDEPSLSLPGPEYREQSMDSLRMTQIKYQTLLHYTEATVVELDLDRDLFHVVYNPVPNFQPMPNIFPKEKELAASDMNQVHPDDVEEVLDAYRYLRGEFFARGVRKHTFTHRIYSAALSDYREHEVTFLRLDTGRSQEHKVIVVWRPTRPLPVLSGEAGRDIIRENEALYGLMSSVICRRNDSDFTILRGSGNLMDLLGYTKTEIQEQFQGKFLELVIPEDRQILRDHVAKALRTGAQVESEYRVRRKDGELLWILEKGYITREESGEECFYGALMNNTRSHITELALLQQRQRTQLIIDQLDDIIFEWDAVEDKLDVSSGWQELFGHDPVQNALKGWNLSNSRVHPDDLGGLAKLRTGLEKGQERQEVELRIADSRGKYIWFRLRLSTIQDEKGALGRVVGMLANIDEAKRAYLEMQAQAQRDPLTGLLNKMSTQNNIRTYLEAKEYTGCALLMIDLDNFKGINDRFGHLFGDTVLTRTAQAIRRLFRDGDIIGRVGGDEFMVLMKEVFERNTVQERCGLLLQELGDLFKDSAQDFTVNCSVGVGMAPEHGRSFQELFQRADQALYRSKEKGKNCFTIYESDMAMSMKPTARPVSTPIDSNERPSLANDGLVRSVFQELSRSDDLERTIGDVLSMVGRHTNVSRVYIFENNDANTHCSNTFEWCNEGITPEIDSLQNICYATDLPGWENNYNENGILFCSDIAQLSPEARAILEPQGIKSVLHCSIRENGVFRGYIGLDECTQHRIWTQEQVDILTFLSEVVASFLLKKRTQDKVEAMSANLHSVLDSQRSWMYIIDPDSHRLLYANSKTQSILPELGLGDVCYRCIMGREAPCPECPMDKMQNGFGKSQLHSKVLDRMVTTEADRITWNGRTACLITSRLPDVEE